MSSVVVNPVNIVTNNLLSLGFHIDHNKWMYLVQNATMRQYAKELNPKLVRVFDFRTTTPLLRPCTQWNEAIKTGTWDWANIDALTNAIFEIGAEPLYCLSWARDNQANYLPPGMAVNPATLLPYPDSFAAYASEWVRHFKQTGRPVRFYELFNEPGGYFINGVHPFYDNLASFITVWQATAQAMRAENPNILLSFDMTENYNVLTYWLANGAPEIDSINFHKYDAGTVPSRTDDDLFNRAETQHYATAWSSGSQNVVKAQAYYLAQRGRAIPILDTESNMNSAWDGGTDPRLQQIAGGVWLALSLRTAMLSGVNYNTYYELCNPKSSGSGTGGWGFGMINASANTRWIPYYVNLMFGKNLTVGDSILETSVNDADLRVIAWLHQDALNIILINKKAHLTKQVSLVGVSGNLQYAKLDETINADNPTPETGIVASSQIVMIGYTVMLLTAQLAAHNYIFKQWQDGDTNPTKTVVVS